MEYKPQYFMYKDLVEFGYQIIKTKDINKINIEDYFYGLINIAKDAIETDFVKSMMIKFIFTDKVEIELSLFDSVFNLMMWELVVSIDAQIKSVHLFFPENITKKEIKEYIDNIFIDKCRTKVSLIEMSQTIDKCIGKFRDLRPFQPYLANSLCLEDTIDLMNSSKDFYDSVHFDITGISLEDIKDQGMDATNTQINIIKNSDHCLRDSFRTGEGINAKQYREVAVNIGTKPDGLGSIFPTPIKQSFMNGGLQTAEEFCIESSIGRIAQIMSKNNVGTSGEFARKLELNNQDTILNPDPDYICDTVNFEEVYIDSENKLNSFDLRYYRTNPLGVDKLLEAKRDKNLIGQKLYFRSPMTCASAAKGHGICYKCYGDLAYVNKEVNVGQIAAEGLSSIYTQTLLSAKHLLESKVIKMNWPSEFYEIFNITFNTIAIQSNKIVRGWKLIIDEEIKSEEELDEALYNYYITGFKVRTNTGEEYNIHTSESDNIYLMPEVYDFITNSKNKDVDIIEDNIEIDMEALKSFDALFIVEMRNNELSKTMNNIKKLIDSKSVIAEYDRNSILEKFINTNMAGGIKLNSVHFEVLLMNQIRDGEDDLEAPDWSKHSPSYRIMPLSKALSNNRSIAVRLESSNIAKALLDPNNDKLNKPSISDLYYMEQPQEFLSNEIISDDYKPRNDKEINIKEPIKFANPKIRVGRAPAKNSFKKNINNEGN